MSTTTGNRCPSAEQYEALAQYWSGAKTFKGRETCEALRAAASLARELDRQRNLARVLANGNTELYEIAVRAESAERERDAAKEKVRVLVAKWRRESEVLQMNRQMMIASSELNVCASELEAIFAATADKEAQP